VHSHSIAWSLAAFALVGFTFGAQNVSAADLRVACPAKDLTAGTSTPLPDPWWSTDQSGRLSRVEVLRMGRGQILVCHYDLNGIEWSVQRRPPDKAPFCTTSGLAFTCSRRQASAGSEDLCRLRPDPGPCKASYRRYYYDAGARQCRSFTWGGCDGTVPFDSQRACESTCLSR
jgi:hypothetical protein